MRLVSAFIDKADDSGVFAELTLKTGVEPQQVLDALVRGGARLRRFERIEPSLHRIFLDRAGTSAHADRREEPAHA
jgi:ABC-2 type transport system ATP-binding protein